MANTHTFQSKECTSYKPKILSGSVYFIEEMSQLLETSIMDNISHIYAGDFNICLNNVDSADICTYNELLECFDLTNHVNFATHTCGHTLDLVISDDRGIIQYVDKEFQFQTIW